MLYTHSSFVTRKYMHLFRADAAGYFSAVDIRWALQRVPTVSFNWIKVFASLRNGTRFSDFGSLINTCVLGPGRMGIFVSHEITGIFQMPAFVALIPTWDSQHCDSLRAPTHSARDTVSSNSAIKWSSGNIDTISCVLDTMQVLVIVILDVIIFAPRGIIRQAYIVNRTARMCVPTTSCKT